MSNKRTNKIPGVEEAWEDRTLGADEAFVKAVDIDNASLDTALDLQAISIRLQKTLIEDFKLIARMNGLGYQPLMRQVLSRFADSEKRRLLNQSLPDIDESAPKMDEVAEDVRR